MTLWPMTTWLGLKLLQQLGCDWVHVREQQIGGSGGSLEPPGPILEPPGPLLTHLHTVYTAYSEHLPTRLNPLAERTCFSQVHVNITDPSMHSAGYYKSRPGPLGAFKRP
jgi:hypothetical protein